LPPPESSSIEVFDKIKTSTHLVEVIKNKKTFTKNGKGLANNVNVNVASRAESKILRNDDFAVKATPL